MMIESKDALRIIPFFELSKFCPVFGKRMVCSTFLFTYWAGYKTGLKGKKKEVPYDRRKRNAGKCKT